MLDDDTVFGDVGEGDVFVSDPLDSSCSTGNCLDSDTVVGVLDG